MLHDLGYQKKHTGKICTLKLTLFRGQKQMIFIIGFTPKTPVLCRKSKENGKAGERGDQYVKDAVSQLPTG
jgi:hypothetical protein